MLINSKLELKEKNLKVVAGLPVMSSFFLYVSALFLVFSVDVSGQEAGELSQGAAVEKVKGVKKIGESIYKIGKVEFNAIKKEIVIPATVNMQSGFVEYVLVHEQGKVHESMFTTSVEAKNFHVAMLLLGVKDKKGLDRNLPLQIEVDWKNLDGSDESHSLLDLIELGGGDPRKDSNEAVPKYTWRYDGVTLEKRNFAGYQGSLIALMGDPSALVNNAWIKQDLGNSKGGGDQMSDGSSSGAPGGGMHGSPSSKKESLPVNGTPVRIKLRMYSQ